MQQGSPSAPPASNKTQAAPAPKALPQTTEAAPEEAAKPKPKFNYYDFKAKREQMAPRLAGQKEKPRGEGAPRARVKWQRKAEEKMRLPRAPEPASEESSAPLLD